MTTPSSLPGYAGTQPTSSCTGEPELAPINSCFSESFSHLLPPQYKGDTTPSEFTGWALAQRHFRL